MQLEAVVLTQFVQHMSDKSALIGQLWLDRGAAPRRGRGRIRWHIGSVVILGAVSATWILSDSGRPVHIVEAKAATGESGGT